MSQRKKPTFKRIKLELIDRPDEIQRMEISEEGLEELAESIQERGLLQPIGVAPRGNRYAIVYGDRRYLAHHKLKLRDILCRVEEIDDIQIVLDRAMENIQRVNLTPFEEAHIYIGLKEKVGMTLEEISKKVGKSVGTVQRRMDIMRMPESFQKALHEKKINVAVAEELWSCRDASKREYFLELAIEHGITRVVAKQWVGDYNKVLRDTKRDVDRGIPSPLEYEDTPIFRACDTCKGPVEYKDVRELRLCPVCFKLILEAKKEE